MPDKQHNQLLPFAVFYRNGHPYVKGIPKDIHDAGFYATADALVGAEIGVQNQSEWVLLMADCAETAYQTALNGRPFWGLGQSAVSPYMQPQGDNVVIFPDIGGANARMTVAQILSKHPESHWGLAKLLATGRKPRPMPDHKASLPRSGAGVWRISQITPNRS